MKKKRVSASRSFVQKCIAGEDPIQEILDAKQKEQEQKEAERKAMGDKINWLVTVLYGTQLLKCALQVSPEAVGDDCVMNPMEPENQKKIHSLLPLHVQSCGPVVSVEEIFEIKIHHHSE